MRLFDEVQARTRDLTEALQQQTATADILKVIASSPSDVQPVFDAVADRAMRLLKCWSVVVTRYDGEQLHFGAACGALPDTETYVRGLFPQRPDPDGFYGRCILDKCPVNDPDRQSCPDPKGREYARVRGFRAALAVPMLAEGSVIGLITATRETVGAFAEEDVRLLGTFADQAAIAINNVSLFNETQEALRQQTATAEVLKTISRSAFDLDSVFEALMASAVSLIGGRAGTICVRDGDVFRYRAVAEGRDSAMWRYLSEHPATPGRTSVVGRVLLSGKPETIRDALADSELEAPVYSLAGIRSIVGVPLLRADRVEGALLVARFVPGPFDQRQIELLQTFADQAVIAIENVRLFEEVQARTRDLTEALQQQTATADVLKVISRSAFDLKAVLAVLVQSVLDLCNATGGNIHLRDGETFRLEMQLGWPEDFAQYMRDHPVTPGTGSVSGRAILTGAIAHIPDVLEDPDYELSEGPKIAGYRALLGVPLLRQTEVIGVFSVGRPAPGSFTRREIELVQDLRRPGRHRDRERSAVRRGAGAHERPSPRRYNSRPRPRTC